MENPEGKLDIDRELGSLTTIEDARLSGCSLSESYENSNEEEHGYTSVVDFENGDTLAVTNMKVAEGNAGDSRERVRRFTFDCCFEETATQDKVFDALEDAVSHSVKQRYHSCVLAYGQSSSGKTHTMIGRPSDPGIIPRLCIKVFDYIRESALGDELECMKITVSYLEIYNEKVGDLLDLEQDNYSAIKTRKRLPLKIREHPKKGPYVQGLSEHPVKSAEDLLAWLEKGNSKRRVAATASNRLSSRSHSVFCINFGQGKLSLIDLAGSERTGCRHSDNISRFKEGANINKSLVALGNVISALAEHSTKYTAGSQQAKDPQRRRFVPYRDSVLTWLLKDTLGGNSNTVMVATISPSSSCYSETINTLRFGQRAKLIVCKPVVHEDPKEKTIRELRAEILRLRELLKETVLLPIESRHQMNYFNNVSSADISSKYTQDNKENNIVQHPEQNLDEIDASNNIEDNYIRNATENSQSISSIDKDEEIVKTTTIEKLLPVIHVKTIRPNIPTQLRRTYSVDHSISKMERERMKNLGSNDSIPSSSTSSLKSNTSIDKTTISSSRHSLRKVSLNKSIPNLTKTSSKSNSLEPKLEKAVSTEHVALKNIVSKVDSRRRSTKPRSQIVAAVTSRLYSKIKKKEVATDTNDINMYDLKNPREPSICSNARLRLKDITKRILKAHRNKNEETQTDFVPLRRVKETSTDVSDLKIVTAKVRDISTMSEKIEHESVSVECNLFEDPSILLTRSCGTQSTDLETENLSTERRAPKGVSFTKYLREIPNHNPIYANSFNINISNNYMNGNRVSMSTSEDSLEEQSAQNTGLPTPDLISNHNSLEPHGASINPSFGTINEVEEFTLNQPFEPFVASDILKFFSQAKTYLIPKHLESIKTVNIIKTHAPEIVINHSNIEEFCLPHSGFHPQQAVPQVIENQVLICNDCVRLREPLVLKSIVKETQRSGELRVVSSDDDENKSDTLDYLDDMANKKVKFSGKSNQDQQRMFKAMSSFLEEATQLIQKIDRVALPAIENDYDLEVTVNNIKGWNKCHKKHERKRTRSTGSSQTETMSKVDNYNQTYTSFKRDSCTQYNFDYSIPINKYDAVLEDSCRILEEKISSMPSISFYNELPNFDYLQQETFNTDVEDSSIESTPIAFSDYGSLPRRTHKRYRRPTCSPSAFLRQLTDMRKQVIKSSREDLLSGSCNHF